LKPKLPDSSLRASQEAYLDQLIAWWLDTTNLEPRLRWRDGSEPARALAVVAAARMLGYANWPRRPGPADTTRGPG
jgi:hypothetical protein